jgi:hypothetical protein
MDKLTLPGSKPGTFSNFEKVEGSWFQRISYLKACTKGQEAAIAAALGLTAPTPEAKPVAEIVATQ